jgi:DNA-binding protein H-NS
MSDTMHKRLDRMLEKQERKERARRERDAADARGEIADGMAYRSAVVARVRAGEITLEQAQAELRRVQRKAKREGRPTYYGTY